MTDPIKDKPDFDINNKHVSFKEQVSYYAGRFWEWLTVSVPKFFTEDIPAFFKAMAGKAEKPDLKDKKIQPPKEDKPPATDVHHLGKKTLSPKKGKEPGTTAPEISLPELFKEEDGQPKIRGANKPPEAHKAHSEKVANPIPKEDKKPAIEVQDLGKKPLSPKKGKEPAAPAPAISHKEEDEQPEIRGANEPPEARGARREKVASPLPKQPLTPTSIAAKIINGEKLTSCKKIPVRDQTSQPDIGFEACGYHSFKNGMVALGAAFNNQITENDFEDKAVYDWFFKFLTDHLKEIRKNEIVGVRDLPTTFIASMIDRFANFKGENIPPKIQAIQKAVQEYPSAATIFEIPAGLPRTMFPKDLNSVGNFKQLKKQMEDPKPFVHVFMVGNESDEGRGHWGTIIMEKDSTGKINWYGCDSWPQDSEKMFKENIDAIKSALDQTDQFVENHYYNLNFVDDFHRLASSFNPNGSVKSDQRSKFRAGSVYPGIKGGVDYPAVILEVFEFAKKVGWLEKQNAKTKGYLTDMKVLVDFMTSQPLAPQKDKFLEVQKELKRVLS